MKGLTKAFYGDSAMYRGWRGIGSPREYVGVFKEKRFGAMRVVQDRSE